MNRMTPTIAISHFVEDFTLSLMLHEKNNKKHITHYFSNYYTKLTVKSQTSCFTNKKGVMKGSSLVSSPLKIRRRPDGKTGLAPIYFTLTSISFGFASSALGMAIVSTPSAYEASILSVTTVEGSVNDRKKDPYERSVR